MLEWLEFCIFSNMTYFVFLTCWAWRCRGSSRATSQLKEQQDIFHGQRSVPILAVVRRRLTQVYIVNRILYLVHLHTNTENNWHCKAHLSPKTPVIVEIVQTLSTDSPYLLIVQIAPPQSLYIVHIQSQQSPYLVIVDSPQSLVTTQSQKRQSPLNLVIVDSPYLVIVQIVLLSHYTDSPQSQQRKSPLSHKSTHVVIVESPVITDSPYLVIEEIVPTQSQQRYSPLSPCSPELLQIVPTQSFYRQSPFSHSRVPTQTYKDIPQSVIVEIVPTKSQQIVSTLSLQKQSPLSHNRDGPHLVIVEIVPTQSQQQQSPLSHSRDSPHLVIVEIVPTQSQQIVPTQSQQRQSLLQSQQRESPLSHSRESPLSHSRVPTQVVPTQSQYSVHTYRHGHGFVCGHLAHHSAGLHRPLATLKYAQSIT